MDVNWNTTEINMLLCITSCTAAGFILTALPMDVHVSTALSICKFLSLHGHAFFRNHL